VRKCERVEEKVRMEENVKEEEKGSVCVRERGKERERRRGGERGIERVERKTK
jgi:hypothetical protein